MSVFLQPIYTQTVGSGGASTINFNNIPQTFTDLLIVGSIRSNFGQVYDDGYIRFGVGGTTDSGSNYSWTVNYGTGSSAASSRTSSSTLMNQITVNGGTTTSSTFGNFSIYIPNYTSSTFKQVIIDYATETNATTVYSGLIAGLWRNTGAISNTSFGNTTSSTFQQYSTLSLYGITKG
jgi:hypothetical protein